MDIKKLPKTEFAAAVAQISGERNINPRKFLMPLNKVWYLPIKGIKRSTG